MGRGLSDQQKAILIVLYEKVFKELPKPEGPYRIRDIKFAIFPQSKKKTETVSIWKALARLRKRGFVNRDLRDGYILTEEGQKIASEAYKRKEEERKRIRRETP